MSVEHKRELQIVDESGDRAVFSSIPVDDDIDFTDDDEVHLVSVKAGGGAQHVNISRADLQELRVFLEEIAEADAEAQG